MVIVIPTSGDSTNCDAFNDTVPSLTPGWLHTSKLVNSADYGDSVSASHWICILTRPRPLQPCHQPVLPLASASFPTFFGDFVQSKLCSQDSILSSLPSATTEPDFRTHDTFRPRMLPLDPLIQPSSQTIAFDPDFPAPEPSCDPDGPSFAIPFLDSVGRNFT